MSIRIEPKTKKSILQVDVYEGDGKTFKRSGLTAYILLQYLEILNMEFCFQVSDIPL
jgi:hypothetical protein